VKIELRSLGCVVGFLHGQPFTIEADEHVFVQRLWNRDSHALHSLGSTRGLSIKFLEAVLSNMAFCRISMHHQEIKDSRQTPFFGSYAASAVQNERIRQDTLRSCSDEALTKGQYALPKDMAYMQCTYSEVGASTRILKDLNFGQFDP